jgi:protein-S-isoprenylcysteine O-methyltransferase Ste14
VTADAAALTLLALIAVPALLFAVGYTATVRGWWHEWIGIALFIAGWGLFLLAMTALFRNWFGDDYPYRDTVRLTAYTLVCTGAWMQLIALIAAKTGRRGGGE